MKCIYLNWAVFCILLRLFCSCSMGDITETGKKNIADEIDETGKINQSKLLFLAGKMVTETEINFEFSQPVKLLSLSFDPGLIVSSIEEGIMVKVFLEESPEPGMFFTAVILAEDEQGETVSALVPMRARNNRVPKLRINELRTEYSRPRSEFIEFKITAAGNMGALRVFAASNNNASTIYIFSPVEVTAGEFVVLHLRTLEDLCKDEYGENLNESGGTDSCPTARDFWIPGSAKLLRKTDAVYVLDQDDRVLSAVMISETPDPVWNRDYLAAAAEFLFSQDAWKSPMGGICSPADAVDSSAIKTAATRSISRDEAAENTNTTADWYVTATGGATPGLPNDPRRLNSP